MALFISLSRGLTPATCRRALVSSRAAVVSGDSPLFYIWVYLWQIQGRTCMRCRRSGVFWLAISLLVLGASPTGAQESANMPGSAMTPAQKEGRRIFVQRCAVCHLPLTPEPRRSYGPALNGVVKKSSEEAVRQMIMNGSLKMPGWRYTLMPDQITSVITYLKTFAD